MSTNKRVAVGLLIGAAILTAAVAGYGYSTMRSRQELQRSAQAIQLAVERFAVDNNGNYPTVIDALIIRGYMLDWPPNPFGPGKMHPIAADAAPVPGRFVYVTSGPIVAYGGGLSQQEAVAQGKIIPSEADQYALVFYGPRHSRRYHGAAASRETPERKASASRDRNEQLDYWDLINSQARIDWSMVALVLTAGEIYVSDAK